MTTEEDDDELPSDLTDDSKDSLRSRALAKYHSISSRSFENQGELSAQEVLKTIHELRVHKIELEMQNDELRRSQIALEESRTRYRDLYDHAPVGYCLVGANGVIHDANSTLSAMLEYAPSNLNGALFHNLIEPSGQDVFYLLRTRILVSQKSEACEVQMRKSDGRSIWVQVSVAIAPDEGDAFCLRVAMMNIDSRVQAEIAKDLLESQLRESQKMEAVGTLAGGIAHDFNNILAVIMLNAEIADSIAQKVARDAVPFVNEIQKAAARARELVKQILAFCRRQPSNFLAISLQEAIEESLGLLRSTMPARFELKYTSGVKVPNVFADGTQIEQVIINLANNAVQAMDTKPGRIRIHLDAVQLSSKSVTGLKLNSELWRDRNTAVRIVFSDDGPGMEPEVVARIFEPFFTTKPVNQGTGLGLAVVHGIIRAHNGQIFVHSQPGHGATFTILLPTAEQTEINRTNVHTDVRPDSDQELLHRKADSRAVGESTVLYVDDDEWVLNSIVQLMRQLGVSVHAYSDPLAALKALRESLTKFHLVITDYNMPRLSGLDFARQARNLRPDLSVVVTSGFINEDLSAQAHEAGVMALMPKPFSAQCFLDLLKQANQLSEPSNVSIQPSEN